MDTEYLLTEVPLLKCLLHAAKHSSRSVVGYLLGELKGGVVRITDAVPLFHSPPVIPLLDISAKIVTGHFESRGSAIVGCYFAPENWTDESVPEIYSKIFSHICSHFAQAVFLKIRNFCLPARVSEAFVPLVAKKGSSGVTESRIAFAERCWVLTELLACDVHHELFDFDDNMSGEDVDWLENRKFTEWLETHTPKVEISGEKVLGERVQDEEMLLDQFAEECWATGPDVDLEEEYEEEEEEEEEEGEPNSAD